MAEPEGLTGTFGSNAESLQGGGKRRKTDRKSKKHGGKARKSLRKTGRKGARKTVNAKRGGNEKKNAMH
jgi:hypothetical protein